MVEFELSGMFTISRVNVHDRIDGYSEHSKGFC